MLAVPGFYPEQTNKFGVIDEISVLLSDLLLLFNVTLPTC
jgi:hypothetical protein